MFLVVSRWLVSLLVLVLFSSLVLRSSAAEGDIPVVTTRMSGDTRIETSVAISQRAFPEAAAVVYLAREDVFADAVSSAPLADGPILLVPACGQVPEITRTEIVRLQPGEVVALGGTGAVCDAVLLAATRAAEAIPTDDCLTGVSLEYSDDDIRRDSLGAPVPDDGDLRAYSGPVQEYLLSLADDYDRREEGSVDGDPDYDATADALRSIRYRSAGTDRQDWRSPDGRSSALLQVQAGRLLLMDLQYPDTC